MSTITADTTEPYVVGSVYNIVLTAKLDGSTWTLTAETVTIYFKDPDGVETSHAMTVASGTASYNFTPDQAGTWEMSWSVNDGTLKKSPPYEFAVVASP